LIEALGKRLEKSHPPETFVHSRCRHCGADASAVVPRCLFMARLSIVAARSPPPQALARIPVCAVAPAGSGSFGSRTNSRGVR
jgi:hypothetical protein